MQGAGGWGGNANFGRVTTTGQLTPAQQASLANTLSAAASTLSAAASTLASVSASTNIPGAIPPASINALSAAASSLSASASGVHSGTVNMTYYMGNGVWSGVPGTNSIPTPAPTTQPGPVQTQTLLTAKGPNGEAVTFPFPTTVEEFSKYIPTADPPIPPNWTTFTSQTLPTLPYKIVHKVPVAPDSVEYQTLAWMIEPSCNVKITGIEQIFNEVLMEKFITHRKDTILYKCKDLQILSGFKLPDRQLAGILNINLNCDKKLGTVLGGVEYSDNICLLFHGTRGNLEQVLEQGLDERVGNGGNLGRGIYFSDDPLKAMDYDGTGGTLLIFMVYLGDCLSSTELSNVNGSTREPVKVPQQSRTARDQTFDSIAGAPFRQQNEFVIYNRYQCVPVFVIKFVRNQVQSGVNDNLFYRLRRSLPEFIWKRSGKAKMAIPGKLASPSPLHAQTIFDLIKTYNDKIQALHNPTVPMEEDEAQEEPIGTLPTDANANADGEQMSQAQEKLVMGLSELVELGFADDELNTKLLIKHNFNMDQVIMELIELTTTSNSNQTNANGSTQPQAGPSTSAASAISNPALSQNLNGRGTSAARRRLEELDLPQELHDCLLDSSYMDDVSIQDTIQESATYFAALDGVNSNATGATTSTSNYNTNSTGTHPEKITCLICCEDYESDAYMKKLQNCEHKVCSNCYKEIETSGTTMTRSSHTFLKCPFCSSISGVQVGTCPDGTMEVSTVAVKKVSWFQIDYKIPSHGLHRVAYLPTSPEGKKVLDLLKIAFDRRLIFSIGTSHTTGQVNTVVWNIHHKTSTEGGEAKHGYPDPTYLSRVKDELKQYGIE